MWTGLAALGLLALILTMGISEAASAAAPLGKGSSGGTSKTGGTFNFSANHPTWNSGNLCNVTTSGSDWSCQYSGSSSYGGHHAWNTVTPKCGTCVPSLTYNFSASNINLTINISGLSTSVNRVYINIAGDHDNILLNLSGSSCRGSSLNVTVLGQHDVLDVNITSSRVAAAFYIYEDLNTYNANLGGSADVVQTYFVGAATRQSACPYANMSRTDSFSAAASGWFDEQKLVWVNAMNYNSNLSWTNFTGDSGTWSFIGWENTTSFSCGWSNAPVCSSSGHHSGWDPLQLKDSE
jgi:hypothetical protein